MSSGRKVKASRGGYAGGGVPLGYKSKRGSGRVELDPEKANVVRTVFDLNASGLNLQHVVDELNRRGMLTAQGCLFHRTQVRRILLHKDVYCGTYNYAGASVAGEHPKLLPNDRGVTSS